MSEEIFEIIVFDKLQIDQLYEEIIKELDSYLPAGCDYHHIGSTALDELETKGDLDICIQFPTEKALFIADNILVSYWQRNETSTRNDYFSSFKREKGNISVGLQLVVKNSSLDVFVKFRDILRSDKALQLKYDALKKRYNGKNMNEYREAKSDFIEKALSH